MGTKGWQLRTIPFLVESKPLRRKSGSHLKFITSPKQAFQFVFHSMYTKPGMSGRGKHRCLEPVFPPLQPLHLAEKPELSIYTCKNLYIFTKLSTLIYKATLLGIDFSIHNLPSTINCLLSTFYCLPSTVYRLPSHRCPNRRPRIFRQGHQLDNQRPHTHTNSDSRAIHSPSVYQRQTYHVQKGPQPSRCPHIFLWGQKFGN